MIRAQIVLSTFNGEKFLAQQLESLVQQSEKNWICLIRDDGSDDNTPEILRHYTARDSRFKIISDESKHLGPCQSFAKLLEHCSHEAPIFFCDQDDFWHRDKIKIFLSHFLAQSLGPSPLVVTSDLALAAADLEIRSASMMSSLGYQPSSVGFENLLGQNIFPGCAMAFDPVLLKTALPIPKEVPMHDWWVALVGSAHGSILHIPEPLVFYRQHDSQASGGSGSANLIRKTHRALFSSEKSLAALTRIRFHLWKALAARLEKANSLLGFASSFHSWFFEVSSQGRLRALISVLKAKIRMQGILRNLIFTLGIFLYFDELKKISRTR